MRDGAGPGRRSRSPASAAYALPFAVPDSAVGGAARRRAGGPRGRGVLGPGAGRRGPHAPTRPRRRCGRRRCGRCAGAGSSVAFPGLAERAVDRPRARRPPRRRRPPRPRRQRHRPRPRGSGSAGSTERDDARMAFEPPQRLVRALGETAPDGDGWLEELPETVRQAVALRELTVERVQAPGGRSSLVVLVRRADGTPAVLKLAPPGSRGPRPERAALAHWNGWGAVQAARRRARAAAALLLERLHPEVSLRSLPEAKALLEAAGTVRQAVGGAAGRARSSRRWPSGPAGRPRRCGRRPRPEAVVAALVDAALAAREELLAARPGGACCCTATSARARCWRASGAVARGGPRAGGGRARVRPGPAGARPGRGPGRRRRRARRPRGGG